MPSGRLSGVKKTYILKGSAIICFLSALLFIFLSFYFNKTENEWFYFFCIFSGLHELIKGVLFNMDSSSYLGSSLLFTGILILLSIYLKTNFRETLYFFSMAISSLYIFWKFSESFHVFLSGIFCLEGVFLLLFLSKMINLTKFLIFNSILLFIFLSVCAIILLKIKKKRRSYV